MHLISEDDKTNLKCQKVDLVAAGDENPAA